MRIGQATLTAAFVFGLFSWSLSADAQQPTKIPRIAILSDETPALGTRIFELFTKGLRDLGWVEGQNIAFERRYADGKDEILGSLADELVRLQPDVIFAIGTLAARAAKTATQTIPIVFARSADPLGSGLVPTLARPGGNLTGLSDQMVETDAKRLELLVMAVPNAKRLGVLWNPDYPSSGAELAEIERAAHSLDREILSLEVRRSEDLRPAFRAMADRRAGALIQLPGTIFSDQLSQLVELATEARLPSMFTRREFVQAGGLMSYGGDDAFKYRRATTFVDKILKGAKPADIPVEQPMKFELVINLNTAKALGLTIPLALLGRADEVIE
jgi:putative tryptophan/tyrosine transport system substrate-binding protein